MKLTALSKGSPCNSLRRATRFQTVILALLTPGLTFWSIPIQANPSGGVVVNGDVTFSGGAGNLQINQGSQKAIIDWADFSIDAGELTQFNQPGSTAAVLNRVTGGNPSAIHGALKANGNVFVINPNGILVGANGTIDVHGLALSTLDVSNGEFLAGGDMVFKGGSGDITNMGRINAIGGDVFLIGRTVTNAAGGTITARNGTVGLAAGEEVLLKEDSGMGNERMFVRAKGSGVSGTGILNNGTIEGASVELKAHGNMFALAINNKGSIRATGVSNYGGSVHLKGIGGGVENSGSIAVSAPSSGSGGRILIEAAYAKVDGMLRAERGRIAINGTDAVDLNGSIDVTSSDRVGGKVEVEGAVINVGASSDIDASGGFGGGVVKIGGGFQGRDASISNATTLTVAEGSAIRANALETGDGGVVILWSDDTTIFEGSVSALGAGAHRSGGFAEISGKGNLGFDGIVDLSSDHGLSGTLLLDPTNVTISSGTASAAVVNNVALSNSLDAGNNVIITTNFGGTDPGNITVNNRVEWYADSAAITPGTLTLLAANDVIFNDSVRSAGTGGINIVAGWDGTTGIVDPLGVGVQTIPGGFNMAAVLDTMPGAPGEAGSDAAGNGGGSIFIGNATTLATQVVVGSRYGDTLVAGHDLIMRGDNTTERFAQLGFADTGVEYQISNANTNGNGINNGLVNEWWGSDSAADGSGTGFVAGTATAITGKDYIALLGGTRFAGGVFDGAGSGATGDITARLSGRADLRAGTTRAYVQIGHGGSGAEGFEERARANLTDIKTTRDGYTINTINGRQFFGTTWRTNTEADIYDGVLNRVEGDITVHAVGDIFMLAAPGITTDPNLVANTNTGSGNYAMIGHGGAENVGSYHGNVTVIAEGTVGDGVEGDIATASRLDGIGIDMVAGRAGLRFVKIGHGSYGEGNSGSIYDASRSGDIVVTAETGAVRMHGYTQTDGRSDQDASIHIGHGGTNTDVGRTDLTFTGLAGGLIDPAAINLTGIRADNSSTGNITVFAGGTYIDPNDAASNIGIGGMGGNQRWAYMQIGHGGASQRADTGEGYQGNIDVQATQGDVLFAAGANKQSNFDWGYGRTHSQIGHGGNNVDGAKGGSVTVLAGQGAGATDGDIIFKAGKHFESFAQIGNGGYGSSGNYDSLVNAADITVTARGDINFESGESGDTNALELSAAYANRWFNDRANGTSRSGYWQAQDRYIMIGHGGRDADGVMANKQDIYVTSGTGDVGAQLGGADGDVTTGGITFIAGTQDRDFAQIGHGGYSNGANDANGFNGDISLAANGGGIVFDGSLQGGERFTRQTRSTDGTAATTVVMQSYDSNTQASVQIGNGGYASRGRHSGDITIFSNGGVDMLGATTSPLTDITFTTAGGDNLNHLSNGVDTANSTANVYMSLSALTDTASTTVNENVLTSGAAFLGRANVKPGSLRIVLSDGTVITDLPDAGNDERTSFIVDDQGNQIGEIVYDQAVVRFNAATIGSGAADVVSVDYQSIGGRSDNGSAQIGHGGYESDGANSSRVGGNVGDITITAASDIRMHGGAYHRSYTQLGHGGLDVKGAHHGDITINLAPGTTGGKLEVLAGFGGHRQWDYQAYGQLGHGGYASNGNHYGDISITNGEGADGLGVLFKSGTTQDSYTQLGHGGRSSRSGENTNLLSAGSESFGLNGDIVIQTDGDIAFVAGTASRNRDSWTDDFRLWSQLGHGGWDADPEQSNDTNYGVNNGLFARVSLGNTNAGEMGAGDGNWGHFGDIVVNSTGGNISFMAGNNVALDQRVDSEGNVLDLPTDANGFLVSHGDGIGRFHSAILGHGGINTSGDHHGNIDVTAQNGSVSVVGGDRTLDNDNRITSYAVIGHNYSYQDGGPNGSLGRADETISVKALGATSNVNVIAGNGEQNFAMIGLGGNEADGTHLSDVVVWAGGDINLQGGIAKARELTRNGEFQDMAGSNGGNNNDLSEFNAFYGTGNLGLVMMDEAAGTGASSRLMNENITAGSVEFRIDDATHTYDVNNAADITDDGAGNLVVRVDLANGSGVVNDVVGTIDYVTGQVTWNRAVIANASDNPDMFIDYKTTGFHRNDAIQSFAQIGHGGNNATPTTSAHSSGAPVLGHGGDIDVRAGVDAAGVLQGAGGDITALAGNDRRTYVQIGHGGTDSLAATGGGAFTGNINVIADGGIRFKAGQGLIDNFNVAWNYDAGAANNNTRALGVTGGTDNSGINDIDYNFAMIGHGGHNSDANNGLDNNVNDPLSMIDGHNGNIVVMTDSGDIDFTGGGQRGYGHFAQVGHGGMNSNGNHFGNIDVSSNSGDINFTGGGTVYDGNNTDHRNYALLGHGGHGMTGNLGRAGEHINATASAGAINFSSLPNDTTGHVVPYAAHVYTLNRQGNNDENHRNRTRGDENFSMLGHGGSFVYGDKTAEINVIAGNGINFSGGNTAAARENGESDNAASYNFAQIGHGGYFSYRQFRNNFNSTQLGGTTFGEADDFNVPATWNGTNWVFEGVGYGTWPTDNSIDAANGVGLPLWDGFDGDINVTATGGNITFTGGNGHNTFAHIGHGGYETAGDHNGDIVVDAQLGSITFNADVDLHGTNDGFENSGNNTWASIGHGGFYSDGEIRSNITLNAGGIAGANGAITFDGGDSTSFAQVGHGGWADGGTRTDRWGGSDAAFRRSNDRAYRPATRSGNIEVDATGDILFTGGNTDGDWNWAMIGHGGRQVSANPGSLYGDGHSGSIDVATTGGEMIFKAGERIGSFTMIGHGGYESFGNHGGNGVSDARLDSDIVVEADSGITFLAGSRSNSNNDARNFARIGHGGWKASFRDNADLDGNQTAILGPYDNGGNLANNAGRNPWEPYTTNLDGLGLDLATGLALNGDPNFLAPTGTISAGAATLGTFMGDITVRTTGSGDIVFHAPNETDGTLVRGGDESYAQIGHGGFYVFGDIEGDITVESAGGIDFAAPQGQSNDGRTINAQGAYAMLGHGGYEAGGEFSGDIIVNAVNTVSFKGGNSADGANLSFAQLGHGGYNSDDDHGQIKDAAKDATGAQPATTNDVGNIGNITVTVTTGDLEFLAGKDSDTYAQLGHGGRSTRDSHSGNITVDVQTGGIRFIAATDHGTGDTNPGGNERGYVQLGHGGNDSDGTHSGFINVSAGTFAAGPEVGRGIVFRGGDHLNTSAQIGHGGHGSKTYGTVAGGGAGLTGAIDVAADGEIRFVAGTFFKNGSPFDVGNEAQNYVQIGHGGYDIDAYQDGGRQLASGLIQGHSGDISVTTTAGGITFLAGQSGRGTHAGDGGGTYHYAQIGHGGGNAQGDHNGSIEVRAGIAADGTLASGTGDILFAAGGGTTDDWGDNNNYAQLGHGGRHDGNSANSSGNFGLTTDTISVMAGNDILLTTAGGVNNYAQIGNGGYNARGDHAGDIQIFAEGNFTSEAAQMLADGSAGTNRVSYSFERPDADGNEHRSLDRAAEFLADTDGTARAAGEADLQFNRAIAGSMQVLIRDDANNVVMTLISNGTDLVVQADATLDNVDANGDGTSGTETFTAGQVVGSYTAGRIQFNQDVNPGANAYGGTRNIGVVYESTQTDRSYAQVGHGGYDADLTNGSQTTVGNTGDIFLAARTGDITLRAGNDDENSSMLGHGGRSTSGGNSGDIHARAGGSVNVLGGADSGGREFAQIGHGGYDSRGDHYGHIKVSAGSGDLFTSLGKGQFDDSFDFNLDGTTDVIQFASTGDQQVNVLGGGVTDATRNGGDDGHAMIGHGGRSSGRNGGTLGWDTVNGVSRGVIGVSATGDIRIEGGGNDRNFAQVGHGGWNENNNVNIFGDVHVISENGDLLVKAGTVRPESYALIGHGDDQSDNTTNSGGNRTGGIQVIADTITLDRSGAELAWIGHTFDRTTNLNNPYSAADLDLSNIVGTYTPTGAGYQVIARSGIINADNGTVNTNGNNIVFTDAFRDNFITPNLAVGSFVYSAQNITMNTVLDGTNAFSASNGTAQANSFTLLTSGDIDVNASIQNAGTGSVNLIAGAKLLSGPIIDAPSIGGANYQQIDHLHSPPTGFMGMAGIKSDGTQFGLANGFSLTGDLAQAEGSVSINANPSLSLGIAVGSAFGATNVLGYRVIVQGGNNANEFAQVGYRDLDGTTAATGDIMIEAKEGGVLIGGGTSNETYAQVGHGGDDLLNAAGDTAARDFSGMISVRADRGTTVGDVEVLALGGNRSAQIGHGGNNNEANLSGDVVVVGKNITLTAGNNLSMSRIGHGGVYDAAGLKGDISGNIYVNYDPDPDHNPGTMDAAVAGGGGAIVMTSGTGSEGSAQIGHGGKFHTGTKTGEIRVENAASVSMTGGNGNRNYMQIGHGGSTSSGAISNANITVNITGTDGTDSLSIIGGGTQEAYAMIGHGGDSADGSVTGSNINIVLADGNVRMAANGTAGTGGNRSHSQIGHGGFNNNDAGDFAGNILVDVQSGGLTMTAGEAANATYTMIGHGGVNNNATTGHTGTIAVNTADDLTITAGLTTAVGTDRFAMIGHGGAASNSTNSDSITLDVGTDGSGNLLATAGGANGAYVQVGHGGRGSIGAKGGALTVDVEGSTSFVAGSANDTYAQLGHGGRGARGDHSGDITLNSKDTLTLTGGNDMRSYAQIGHGGHDADATGTALGNTGEIMINVAPALVQTTGADILLTAGNGEESYVQVGHGGFATQGDHSSTEIQMTTDGDLVLRSGNGTGFGDDSGSENLGEGQRAYALIGHGGYNAAGNNAAEICIHVGGTITMDSAAGGTDNTNGFTMIGHGGRNVAGNHSGEITVVSGTSTAGGLTMTAGDANRQFVQIGHGGDTSSGNMSGAMFIVVDDGTGGTAGDLLMSGGAGNGSYAMIGQGDGRGTYGNFGSGNTSGTRSGGIQYFVNNNAVLNTGTALNTNAHLLHRTTDGGELSFPGSYQGGTGYQYVVNGTTSGTAGNLARENESTIVAGNVGGGNVVITNTGDLTLNIPTNPDLQFKDDDFNFIVLATGNLTFNRSIQNAGSGNVALVAGWNGVQDTSSVNYVDPFGNINFCEPEIIPGAIDFNDCDAFGLTAATGTPGVNTGGILTVGSAGQTTATRVGSRLGETILRGNQIDLVSGTAANTATQIGFYGTGVGVITGKTGTIDIQAKAGGFNINAGAGAGSYVQVGHGGAAGGAGGGPTGVLTAPSNPTGLIDGLINISFCEPGAISVTGGTAGAGAFAQIGHGIAGQTGNVAGNISVTNFTDLSLNGSTGDGSAAQIGHGGLGDKSGTITLTGTTTVADQGNLTMTSGGGTDAFTQIGHGGLGITSGTIAATSAVEVTNVKAVSLTGGALARSHSQIGNGGNGHTAAIGGDVKVAATGDIKLESGAGASAYTLIGLGGDNLGSTALAAVIDVATTGGGISLTSGTGNTAFSQIGIGGSGNTGAVSTTDFKVNALNDIVLTSVAGFRSHTMIGLGGDAINGTKTGDINVTTTAGGVQLTSADTENSFSLIGAGGQEPSDGAINGNVTVQTETDITLMSGSGENAFTMIGQGGNGVTGTKAGQVTVTSDNGGLSLTAGTPTAAEAGSFSMIGAGGNADASGAITTGVKVDVMNNIAMTSGASNRGFTMIGIGGRDSNGNHNANIDVDAGGTLTMMGGTNTDAFSMIGIGGYSATGNLGSSTTTVDVKAGGMIDLDAGTGARAFVQIGVGGYDSDGAHDASVTVDSGGAFTMIAGGTDAYAQVGLGGNSSGGAMGSATTVTTVTAVNDIAIKGGTANESYAQIGAGGESANGTHTGDVKVDSTSGSVSATGGSGYQSYTQIGNGGSNLTGAANGSVDIDAGTSITFMGGTESRSYSLAGHGGILSNGNRGDADDVISLNAGTSVDILAGTAPNAFAHVGVGGLVNNATPTHLANIDVTAGTNVTVRAGTDATEDDSYAMIGNGGTGNTSNATGTIRVDARNGALTVAAGAGNFGGDTGNFAQIGHGGHEVSGVQTGEIVVLAASIDMDGGTQNETYAQIGHGGFDDGTDQDGALSGDIYINVDHANGDAIVGGTGNISLASTNARTDAYTQIGHGGTGRTDAATGNIIIGRAAAIELLGGGTRSYSQIGHGGATATSANDGVKSGNITITESTSITVNGGTGADAYAQIGHGGNENRGNTNGNVSITTTGELDITGGSNSDAYAQVGHGGHLADGNHGAATDVIRILAGALDLNATAGGSGGAYAQLGHGGYDADGAFTSQIFVNFDETTFSSIAAAGALTMDSAAANNAYTQIGHGGANSGTEINTKTGNILVGGFTSVTMNGGAGGVDAYSQIGHGGDENRGDASGIVAVTTAGAVTMAAGSGSDAYVQIGHGGHDSVGALGAFNALIGVNDLTIVFAGLGVDMDGGGDRSYAQIGAGGFNADGTILGGTYVNYNPLVDVVAGAGAITMNSGSGSGAYTQIGIGGTDSDAAKTGDVRVGGDSVALVAGGGDAYSQIGAGGGVNVPGGTAQASGAITSNTIVNASAGNVTVNATGTGAHAYAQIGAGGLLHNSAMNGGTTVTATGNVALTGGAGSNRYAMIGTGGTAVGEGVTAATLTNANTSVTAANVTMMSGAGSAAYTQIGSGGGASGGSNRFVGTIDGTTTVAASGAVSLTSSGVNNGGFGSYSQIGIGGYGTDASTMNGDTTVTFGNGLTLNASAGGPNGYAQIGAGGADADGTITSNTRATGTGAIALTSGAGATAYTQIGIGGAGSGGALAGNVVVGGDSLALTGGGAANTQSQVGNTTNGGSGTTGFVTVNVANGITMMGGSVADAAAQIGHSIGGATETINGSVSVVAGGDIGITGGAIIGHGNTDGSGGGTRTGGLNVYTTGAITFTDGAAGPALVSHQTSDGVAAVSYAGGTNGGDQGYSLVGLTGINMASILQQQNGNGGALISLTETIGVAAAADDVLIASGGVTDLTIGNAALGNVSFNSASNVNLLSGGNLNIVTGLQNAGAGDMNLLAGWTNTGSTMATAPIMTGAFTDAPVLGLVTLPDFQPITVPAILDPSEFGANGGQILIGDGNQTEAIAVGTAGGLNQVAGSGVVVQGSNTTAGASAQIGFNNANSTATTGDIKVTTHAGGLSVLAGTAVGAFAQVGDGGAGGTSNLDGDITIDLKAGTALAVPTAAGVLQVTGGGDQAYAQIGNGGLRAVGTKLGDVKVTAAAPTIQGGTGFDAYARVGNGGSRGSGDLGGEVSVTSTVGDVSVLGGSNYFTEAAIGHGGLQYVATTLTGGTTVDSELDVIVTAGGGVQASAQIGSGGIQSTIDSSIGAVSVTAGNDIKLTGGPDIRAFSQIGHGGATAAGSMSGAVDVVSGNDIIMFAADGFKGAYAKIGHGDDMFSTLSGIDAFGGTGSRSGDITVTAASDIVLTDGMIGHVNHKTGAVALDGVTQVAAIAGDPTNAAAGSIIADSDSEFAGADELRFYVPERSSNDIVAGALLNGEAFVGAETDPSLLQRDDEFTVNITGAALSMPGEHSNVIGTGPAPANAAGFAFYYNSIELTVIPGGPGGGSGGGNTGGGGIVIDGQQTPFSSIAQALGLLPQDKTANDWQRENEGLFTGFNSFGMSFAGFDHYDSNGNPIFDFVFANQLDSSFMQPVGFENILETQERILEEVEEANEEAAAEGAE